MSNPKQLGRIGIFYLEEAVLEVMGDEPLKAWEISKRLGIPAYSEQNTWNYAIVHGILRKLQAEGRVERSPFPTIGQDWKRIDMDV